jgi:signal transduction histidine kinase
MEVRDNGRGFVLDQQRSTLGHGLSNMGERASQAGGELQIASTPGGGTVVTVSLPATGPAKAARPPTKGSARGARRSTNAGK